MYFFIISFVQYKENITLWISISKLLYVLPAFTCTSDIGSLIGSICLEVNVRIHFTLVCFIICIFKRNDDVCSGPLSPATFIGNSLSLKVLRNFSLPLKIDPMFF